MRRIANEIGNWLDDRFGHRAKIARVRDERLPPGTAWWFTLGGVLLFGIVVEIVTGVILSLYYAPTPDHAWDSVRFIESGVRGGAFIRALHYWGATIIVSVMALHVVRVVVSGGYRKPREANWIIGVVLLQVILAFAMTGYLLPWDQRAYWATVVRVSIAKLTPLAGEFVATVMRGGPDIGAMTLLRWYSLHTLVLPLVLVLLVVVHLALRRRDGLSGPVQPVSGETETYFPSQAARDLTMVFVAAALLAALAWHGMPALEPQADPTSSDYIPRPEWYFAGLFQFVKMFPGKFEVIGAMVIPGIAMGTLALLPWIDRGKTRQWRDRKTVLALAGAGFITVATFTVVGAMDVVPRAGRTWTLTEVAGATLISTNDRCSPCHKADGIAALIEPGHITKAPDWIAGHVADPQMIAPGLREAPASNDRDTQAIIAAIARFRGGAPPAISAVDQQVAVLFNRNCITCHKVDGSGGKEGPDLTREGTRADQASLEKRIAAPTSVKPNAEMPAFGAKLKPEEIALLAGWLAKRK